MKTWHYKTETIGVFSMGKADEILGALGKEGWEAVSATNPAAGGMLVLFKRPGPEK